MVRQAHSERFPNAAVTVLNQTNRAQHRTLRHNRSPLLPAGTELLLLGKLDFVEVVRRCRGELNLKLYQGGFAVGLRVQRVERCQRGACVVYAESVCQCSEIKVVARGIANGNDDLYATISAMLHDWCKIYR